MRPSNSLRRASGISGAGCHDRPRLADDLEQVSRVVGRLRAGVHDAIVGRALRFSAQAAPRPARRAG